MLRRSFGAPAAFVTFVTNAFFLAAWDPHTPLKAAVLSGVTNLTLDLLLVNVFGWGIAGAAIATVAAQASHLQISVHPLLQTAFPDYPVQGLVTYILLMMHGAGASDFWSLV